MITVDSEAERLYPGLTYDCALPEPWVDEQLKLGFDPRSHVIWAYPEGSIFGEPWPITGSADAYLANPRARKYAETHRPVWSDPK